MHRRTLPFILMALIGISVGSTFQPQAHLQVLALQARQARQGNCHTFIETDKTVCGRFLTYWQTHGGLPQQGFPISSEFREKSDLNGQTYTVQYFERAVFEMHPESAAPNDVLLSQLGTFWARHKYGNPSVFPATPTPTLTPIPLPPPRTLTGHTETVISVAFSPDGQTLASGALDNTIRLWRVSNGSEMRTLSGHTGYVNSVAFSPDGQTLASGSGDNTIKLWKVSDGHVIRTLSGHTSGVNSVAFSPDGQTLASGSDDYTIRLWRASDGSLIRTLTGHTGGVYSLMYSPDGQMLATGSNDMTIKLWKVSDGSLIRTLTGHTDYVQSVAFSPDGQTLASGSADNTIKLWKVKPVAPVSMIVGSAFQPLAHLQVLARQAQQGNCHTFNETGKIVCGKFLAYWQTHGGLAQQGFPISGEFQEKSDLNGQTYTVQFFERDVFELHPENYPPYDVLLSQLGTFWARHKYGNPPQFPGTPIATATATPTPIQLWTVK